MTPFSGVADSERWIFPQMPNALLGFEREAKLLASLNHPAIAAIYGLEEHDNSRFIVLALPIDIPTNDSLTIHSRATTRSGSLIR